MGSLVVGSKPPTLRQTQPKASQIELSLTKTTLTEEHLRVRISNEFLTKAPTTVIRMRMDSQIMHNLVARTELMHRSEVKAMVIDKVTSLGMAQVVKETRTMPILAINHMMTR
jgi:hypothetical protein